MLASGLGDQKITTLGLANGIVQVPIGLFAGALAVPLFPLLSEYVKQQRMEDMKGVLAKGFLYQYHILAPATVGLILLAEEFVRIFYAHGGNFTDEACTDELGDLVVCAVHGRMGGKRPAHPGVLCP